MNKVQRVFLNFDIKALDKKIVGFEASFNICAVIQCLFYKPFQKIMNHTKIVPQNEQYTSKKGKLEAQIADLSAHHEFEQFDDTPYQQQKPPVIQASPPEIIKEAKQIHGAVSTTQEKSRVSSRKHQIQGPSSINHNQVYTNSLPLFQQTRPRQKSNTYQQKADHFHMVEASGIRPNLLMAEDNYSPVHQPNANLVIKPHYEEEYNPYKHQARTNKLKNEDARYQVKKGVQQPQQEVNASIERKKARRLPSINMDSNRNSHLFASHDSSTIILAKKKQEKVAHQHEDVTDEAIQHRLRHILQPLQKKTAFTFIREQSCGINYIHPDYKIQSNDGTIQISAKKQYLHFNSYYHITHAQFGSQIVLASLQGNFGGTEFNLYRNRLGQDQLIATIMYESACGSPYRRTEVYIKTTSENDPVFHRETLRKNLKELHDQGHINILKLVSRAPTYNTATETYTMNFGGKGKLPSIKNTILTTESDRLNKVLLFCKQQEDNFHLEVGKPLSLLVAMGILMSSFDFKLLCQ